LLLCVVSSTAITAAKDYPTADASTLGAIGCEKVLTKRQAKLRRQLFLSYTVGHVYTDEEIKNMVKKSVGLDKSKATEYTTAMESLQKKLVMARENTDYEAMELVQKTIDSLQRRYDEQKTKFDRAASRQLAVNRKMRENNVKRDMEAGKRYVNFILFLFYFILFRFFPHGIF
jgi:hypothetical protein